MKIDKLHSSPKPTGIAPFPCFVTMAKAIKEAIYPEEVICTWSLLNDEDKDLIESPIGVINGTHLLDREQKTKRPITKRTRR